MDRLIYVNKGHIPNLEPLGPLLHVEKFVVGGGWWWVVVEADFSVKLEPQAEQFIWKGKPCKNKVCGQFSVPNVPVDSYGQTGTN